MIVKHFRQKAPIILRRTLSDFHECPMVKLNVSSELFSGVNLFKRIESLKIDKNVNSESSVSDEISSIGNLWLLIYRKRVICTS
jgi:hypothetical protein